MNVGIGKSVPVPKTVQLMSAFTAGFASAHRPSRSASDSHPSTLIPDEHHWYFIDGVVQRLNRHGDHAHVVARGDVIHCIESLGKRESFLLTAKADIPRIREALNSVQQGTRWDMD